MSAEQTDVLISLRLLSDKGNQTACNKLAAEVDAAYKKMEAAAERSAMNRGGMQDKVSKAGITSAQSMAAGMSTAWDRAASSNSAATSKMMAGLAKMTAAEKNLASESEKSAKRTSDARDRATKKAIGDVDRLTIKLDRLEKRQESLAIGFMRSSANMARGFGEIAEGAALLGIAEEKDLEKMAHMFVALRGLGSMFRGVLEIAESMVSVTSILNRITHSIEQEERIVLALKTAQAVAGGASAAGAAAHAGGGIASGAAGAAGGIAGGAAASHGGAGGMLAHYGGILGGAAKGVGIFAGKLALVGLAGLGVYEAFAALGRATGKNTESMIGAMSSWRKAAADAEKAEEKTKGMEERRDERHKEEKERDEKSEKKAGLEGQSRASWREVALARGGEAGEHKFDHAELEAARKASGASLAGMKNMPAVTKMRLENDDELEARVDKKRAGQSWLSRKTLRSAEIRNTERIDVASREGGGAPDYGKVLGDLERYKTAVEHVLESQKKHTEQIKSQLDRQRELNAAAQEAVDSAKKQVELEKDKLRSKEAAFGKLSSAERAQATAIGHKLSKGGKLDEGEARFLDTHNIGKKHTERFFSGKVSDDEKKGLSELGEADELKDARGQQGEAMQDLVNGWMDEVEVTNAYTKAKQESLRLQQQLNEATQRLIQISAQQQGVNVNTSDPGATGGGAKGGGGNGGAVDAAAHDIVQASGETSSAIGTLTHEVVKGHNQIRDEVRQAVIKMQMNGHA